MLVFLVLITMILIGMMVHRFCGLRYLLWYVRIRYAGNRLLHSRSTPAKSEIRVVISLTSIPSRVPRLFPTLNSLLLQTRPADRICLHLPKVSKREGRSWTIPEDLERDSRISIHWSEEDHGPVMKLLPTLELERDSETVILTVDDDMVYPQDLVETLLRHHALVPGAALGLRGWNIPNSGRYRDSVTRYACQIRKPLRVDILTGVSGVLYQRRHFREDFSEDRHLPSEGFYVDDIRISGYLARQGVPRVLVPHPIREPFCIYLFSSRSNPLWKINRDGRNNQILMDHFFKRCERAPDSPSRLLRFYSDTAFPVLYPAFDLVFHTHNHFLLGKRLDPRTHRRILLGLLRALDHYLNQWGVPYWLDWGTLLGCVREGGMIPYDNDIDVGILRQDHLRILKNRGMLPRNMLMTEISRFWPCQKVLPILNLWKRKTFLRLVDRDSGSFIDLFEYERTERGYQTLPWMMLQRHRAFPGSGLQMECHGSGDIFPLGKMDFEQGSFPVPARPHAVLRRLYGEDYMTPDHVWNEGERKWVPRV